jgi:hypothetical protein
MRTVLAVIVGLAFVGTASAADLKTVESKVKVESSIVATDALACDRIIDALHSYRSNVRSLHVSAVTTTSDTANAMSSWHRTLSPYEGYAVNFPYGYFRPIADSARNTDSNARYFDEQFYQTDRELARIMEAIDTCF